VFHLNSVAQVALRAQSELFVEMYSKLTPALCSTALQHCWCRRRMADFITLPPLGASFNMRIQRDWILIWRISVAIQLALPGKSYWHQIISFYRLHKKINSCPGSWELIFRLNGYWQLHNTLCKNYQTFFFAHKSKLNCNLVALFPIAHVCVFLRLVGVKTRTEA
jgi:hypothetical protein